MILNDLRVKLIKKKKKTEKTHLGLAISVRGWYNTRMTVKENICNGSEVVFDGNTWGIVTDTDLENNQVEVMDEDGGEEWIDLDRVDHITKVSDPVVSACSPAWEYRKTWRG